MAKLFNQKPDGVPQQDAKWNAGDSLGVKIEKVFTRFFQRVILWGWEFFAEIMVQVFDASMKILKPGMMRMFDPFLTEIANTRGIPENVKAMINRVKSEQGEAGVIGASIIILMLAGPLLQQIISPIAVGPTQDVTSWFPRTLPSAMTIARAYLRGTFTEAQFMQFMGWMGYDLPAIIAIRQEAENVPTIGENIEFLRRGLIDDAEFELSMKRLSVPAFNIQSYKDLAFITPPVNDLIRFMVREAFDDATSQKFGYDDDYPADIDRFLPRVGLSSDWGKRYWRAHWNLPSPTQAYEMLHRGLIDATTLRELLKTSDYPTFWREKLEAISFTVLTRIDVRRLLQAGFIDADKAFETYKKMGYEPADAQLLTDFAVKGIAQDEKDLTKTEIINLYEEGLTDRNGTASNLIKMGYDSQEAEEMLKLADVNISKAARVDAINYVKERYQARVIDKGTAQNELAQAGLKQKSVERYLLSWDRIIESDVAIPSKADIRKWYMNDFITEAQYREYLKLLKYKPADIDLYVLDANNDKQEAANEQTI